MKVDAALAERLGAVRIGCASDQECSAGFAWVEAACIGAPAVEAGVSVDSGSSTKIAFGRRERRRCADSRCGVVDGGVLGARDRGLIALDRSCWHPNGKAPLARVMDNGVRRANAAQ